jgi:hypothetical protein
MPQTFSGRVVAVARSVMEMDEVLVRSSEPVGSMPSSVARASFLGSTRSVMASMAASASARSCGLVVQRMRS